MKTLFDATKPVKVSDHFAAGLVDEILERQLEIGRPRMTGRQWERELRACLRSLAYPSCNVEAAVAWVVSRGKIDACPVVDREDYDVLNAIVRKPVCPAADKPVRFEPSSEDRAWAAAEFEHQPDEYDRWAASMYTNEEFNALFRNGLGDDDIMRTHGCCG